MRRLLAALLLLATPVLAQVQPTSPPASPAAAVSPAAKLEIPFEQYRLPNGLEVILSQDKRLPVVTVNLWYHVGAFHEQPGRTGFAHLFEHMMFQGSKHVGDDQHIAMLEKLGATSLNGTTNFDRTNYFETVPSNHLETALWLESDRMGFLLQAITPEKLATQKEVVKNERRQSTETAPYGLAEEAFWQALFPAPHPYHGVVIGSMADLEAATQEDVKTFFNTWYAPANATLAVVGDFDKAQAKALIEKYFGGLPSGPKPAKPKVADVSLSAPVVIEHEETIASLPKLFIGWLTPALFAEGDATADILGGILSTGKTSRLYKRLVHEKKLAQSVDAYQQSLGAQSVFTIEAIAAPGKSLDEVQREIDAILDEVRTRGVTQAEVQRVRTRLQTGYVTRLQTVSGKADQLQSYNHFLGDPGRIAWDLARYDTVTPQMVQQFAQQQLNEKRVVVKAVPRASAPAAQEAK
jgi:predicted Zn-dependent peptidase